MSSNEIERKPRSHAWAFVILFVAVAAALLGNVYQFARSEHMEREMKLAQVTTERQIGKLTDAVTAAMEENRQRVEALKTDLQGATAATLRQARSEVRRTSSQVAAGLEKKHNEVVSQLSDLKEDTSNRLNQVSTDVQQTGSDLKRMIGDMGVMSGEVATNSKQLASLRELGERNYFELDLTKTKAPQKVGDIRVLLKKTDPKHNRYTVEVLADDKTVEKKDRTINEPVQLYVSGSRQPYELVINEVKKNEVVGYLATPKVKVARGQTT